MLYGEGVLSSVTNLDAYAADAGFLAACVGQQNVLRFEVSVNDPLAVEDAHGCGDLL